MMKNLYKWLFNYFFKLAYSIFVLIETLSIHIYAYDLPDLFGRFGHIIALLWW
jgi:hypothetical protein